MSRKKRPSWGTGRAQVKNEKIGPLLYLAGRTADRYTPPTSGRLEGGKFILPLSRPLCKWNFHERTKAMNAIEEMLRTEIRVAYIEGKSGKPCAVWPPLAREASAQEITRTAEKIAGQLAELPELAGVSLG